MQVRRKVEEVGRGGGGKLRTRRSHGLLFFKLGVWRSTTRPRFWGNVVEAGRVPDSAGEGRVPAHGSFCCQAVAHKAAPLLLMQQTLVAPLQARLNRASTEMHCMR